MKIGISNIAWDHSKLLEYLSFLKKLGFGGVEIAPSKIWPDPIISIKKERNELKKIFEKFKLQVIGFHSLLYNRPDLEIFKDQKTRKKTTKYLNSLVDLCADLGGTSLVFGSPRNRKLNGRKYAECFEQIKEDLLIIGNKCKDRGVYFCIEALSKNETDFITSFSEGGELINEVGHPNVRLHLDTKVIFGTKEDPSILLPKYQNIIQHVHIGDQGLNEPGSINNEHQLIANSLKKIGYSKFLSIEMKKNDIDPKASIKRSYNFVKKIYLS